MSREGRYRERLARLQYALHRVRNHHRALRLKNMS